MDTQITPDLGKTLKLVPDLSNTQKLAVQFGREDTVPGLLKTAISLETLCKSPYFSLLKGYDSIDVLDTATRKHQKQIVDDYLGVLHANRLQEKHLWEAAHRFWLALSAAYLRCIDAAEEQPPASSKLRSRLPLWPRVARVPWRCASNGHRFAMHGSSRKCGPISRAA